MVTIETETQFIMADFALFHETLLENPPEDRDLLCAIAAKDPMLILLLERLNIAYASFKAERIKHNIVLMQFYATKVFSILLQLYAKDVIPYFYAHGSNMKSGYSGFSFERKQKEN